MENQIENKKNLNPSQVIRTCLLINTLKRNPYQKLDNLTGQLGGTKSKISKRTFHRLIETLYDFYGIKITFDFSRGGYFFDEEKSTNPKSFLSLLEILATAELFTSNYKEKNDVLSFVEFENEAATATIPNFKMILEAIQQQLPITFNHYSFYHLKEDLYTLKPYFLKQYQNRWYVIGETEKGFRTFGIDRIENITIGTKKFKPRTEEAKNKFSHVIGLNYLDHKLEKIHLSFQLSQKPYLISLPLHHSQKEINPDKGKTFDIELRIHPNFEFRQQVLKYGSLVKVLEPKWLAVEIKEDLKKAFESY
jgi:predicted DNA-binding transcriptional regulator YafY